MPASTAVANTTRSRRFSRRSHLRSSRSALLRPPSPTPSSRAACLTRMNHAPRCDDNQIPASLRSFLFLRADAGFLLRGFLAPRSAPIVADEPYCFSTQHSDQRRRKTREIAVYLQQRHSALRAARKLKSPQPNLGRPRTLQRIQGSCNTVERDIGIRGQDD